VEKLEAEINRLPQITEKLRRLYTWVENSRKREQKLEQEIALLKQTQDELNKTITQLREQLSAAKAAGLQNNESGGKMDAELRQYIGGLIREIDKSLKNWED
jgi:septal ring factor EnvC (AmiA/AmiB activator)